MKFGVKALFDALNNNGKITYKRTAIELLKVSLRAWAFITETGTIYYSPNFTFDGDISVRGDYVNLNINAFIPQCVLRKDHKFVQAYIGVQKSMKTTREFNYNFSPAEPLATEIAVTKYQFEGKTDGCFDDFTKVTYDHSELGEAVNEEYQKYLSSRRK